MEREKSRQCWQDMTFRKDERGWLSSSSSHKHTGTIISFPCFLFSLHSLHSFLLLLVILNYNLQFNLLVIPSFIFSIVSLLFTCFLLFKHSTILLFFFFFIMASTSSSCSLSFFNTPLTDSFLLPPPPLPTQ